METAQPMVTTFEIYLQIPSVLRVNEGNSGFLQHLSPSSGTTETLSLLKESDPSLPKLRITHSLSPL